MRTRLLLKQHTSFSLTVEWSQTTTTYLLTLQMKRCRAPITAEQVATFPATVTTIVIHRATLTTVLSPQPLFSLWQLRFGRGNDFLNLLKQKWAQNKLKLRRQTKHDRGRDLSEHPRWREWTSTKLQVCVRNVNGILPPLGLRIDPGHIRPPPSRSQIYATQSKKRVLWDLSAIEEIL